MSAGIFATLLGTGLAFALSSSAAPSIRLMLLDGEQAGPYHAWHETTPYLKRILEDVRIFQVDVVTVPPPDGDFSLFQPDWSRYQVVVANYDASDERWSDSLKTSFERYVHDGGGFMTTYQRATEWAATGKVTQKVPRDFPTADKIRTLPEYDPPGWISQGGRSRPAAK